MTQPTYAELLRNLQRLGIPVREISSKGRLAVTQAAGRIIGAAFAPEAENLFWSHPLIVDEAFTLDRSAELAGGLGGERLWFSPELDYNWDGPPDWQSLSNYRVAAAIDPGAYEFLDEGPNVISLRSTGWAPVHGVNRRVGFEVMRRVRTAPPPVRQGELDALKVDYLGIETYHRLRLHDDTRTGRLGLWHLLQVPIGSTLVVPIKVANMHCGALQAYTLPGDWKEREDHVSWRFEGLARAKVGISARVLTGRSAVLRRVGADSWCMIIRDFPVDRAGSYIDHPFGVPRDDQAFQAWDGLGFGEMEFHSPGLGGGERGPRACEDSDRLWAFKCDAGSMASLARRLLEVDIGYLL